MTTTEAERIALAALAWIAETEDLLGVFLGSSGMAPGDLAAQAESPDTLAAVLDFLCMDDAWIRSFADARGLPAEAPLRARHALPGGGEVNWT